jgi:uncharacterized protein YkwD
MNGKLTTTIITATMIAVTGVNLPASASPDELLAAHNKYRQAVNIPSLAWSDSLSKDAQQWANQLASKGGKLQHAKTGQGENLALGGGSYTQLVEIWGKEKQKYNNEPVTSKNLMAVGHYTQMVWKDTKQVGCASANVNNGKVLVCRYLSAGNVMGKRPY